MIRLRLAALIGALFAVPAHAQPADAPRYVMRHLHTPAGERDPDLTEIGKSNAEALVHWFHGKELSAIYVSDYKRTRQTAGPLAADRALTVKIYNPADTPALIELLKAEKGPVLVVGHSNTVPDVIAALGGEKPTPLVHEDFGDIWMVVGGKTEREGLAQ